MIVNMLKSLKKLILRIIGNQYASIIRQHYYIYDLIYKYKGIINVQAKKQGTKNGSLGKNMFYIMLIWDFIRL